MKPIHPKVEVCCRYWGWGQIVYSDLKIMLMIVVFQSHNNKRTRNYWRNTIPNSRAKTRTKNTLSFQNFIPK